MDSFRAKRYARELVAPYGASLFRQWIILLAGKFTHNNDAFTCLACGRGVPPRAVGCRNHCPFCLSSRHVDLYPGDRANPCQGLMRAYGYEISPKKGLVLLFRCECCGAETRNVSAYEDAEAPDDYELILRLRINPPGR